MRSLAAAISPGYFGFTDWAFAAEAASETAVQVPIATRKNNALIIGSSHIRSFSRRSIGSASSASLSRSSHRNQQRPPPRINSPLPRVRGSPQLTVGTRLRPGSQKESTASLILALPVEDRSATPFPSLLAAC